VRDTAGLLQQLRRGSAEQRRWAARDLAARPEAAAALGEQLLAESDARVRDAILVSLSSIASDAAATALLPLLRSDDAMLRNGAIEALAGMPQAVAPKVAALLRDADADVRIFTVNMLGELRHAQVVPWLLQVLAEDAEVNVVAAALEVLAEVGQPAHVDALVAATRRFGDNPFIQFAAQMARERIEAA
jgi:HEAT repeat protein